MNIVFLGSGNVATHLSQAFYHNGHHISQIWSRTLSHAQRLAQCVEAVPLCKLEDLDPYADLYVLCVVDDAIAPMVESLAKQLPKHDTPPLWIHTSGTRPADVLKPLTSRYGVLWSPQSFVREVALDLSASPFCIEGSSPETTAALRNLIKTVSNHLFELDSQQRQWAHLSAVIVNNFGNYLNSVAQQLLGKQNIPFELLAPIINTTAIHAINEGTTTPLSTFQTGPAIRHDILTLQRHQQLLENEPDILQLYTLLSSLIAKQHD